MLGTQVVKQAHLAIFINLAKMYALIRVNDVVADEREGALEELLLRLVSDVALPSSQVPAIKERLIHTLIRAIVPLNTILFVGAQ